MEHTPEGEREKAILVGVEPQGDDSGQVAYSMEELVRLADTAGADVLGQVLQKRNKLHAATFLGRGKAEEVAALCREVLLLALQVYGSW